MSDRMLSDEILLGIINSKSGGGGGGGTDDYNDLKNQPKINNNTLVGNKTASDLGLVAAETGKGLSENNYTDEDKAIVGGVTAALAGKQGVLTAGNYVSIADDGTIKVTQSIGVYDVYSYELMSTGVGITIQLTKKINNVTISTQEIRNEDYSPTDKLTVDGLFELWYDMSNFYWHYKLLVDSEEHQKNEDISWYYRTMADYTETFNVSQDSSTDLATKGDVNAAINAIKDGTSIDSFADVETALALKQDKTDNSLQTTNKTVVGAINEHEGDISSLKSGFTALDNEVNGDATTYPYADVITIEDAIPANLAECNVKIEPVQDLHGYDHPWVGGAGKNKLPMTVDSIKTLNTTGTWSGNDYTINGGTFTLYTDDGGNITSIKVNGTFTNVSSLYLISSNYVVASECKMNGCPDNGTYNSTYSLWAVYDDAYEAVDSGNGITLPLGTITQVRIRIAMNYTANNLMFYPMIRLSTETDATFAPYTNICPISGHTEASVQRDGKNLFDNTSFGDTSFTRGGVTFAKIEEGHYRLNGTCTTTVWTNLVGNGDSVVSCKQPVGTYIAPSDDKIRTYMYYGDDLNVSRYVMSTRSTVSVENEKLQGIRWLLTQGSVFNNFDLYAQIEEGDILHDFEPYAGKTYTIALGDTIYGGTVDFDSGVMTVTRKCVDLGSLDFTYDESQRFSVDVSGMKSASIREAHFITSCYLTIDDGRPYSQVPDFSAYAGWGGNAMKLAIHDSRYSDAATYKTAITGQTICYELATPTTIQLTPQQIQLLKGTNTLTASTGQISVTVNGVSGAIGSVQTAVNELAEQLPDAPTTDGAYILTVTVADGAATYSWKSAT